MTQEYSEMLFLIQAFGISFALFFCIVFSCLGWVVGDWLIDHLKEKK